MATTANILLNQGETFRWSFVLGTRDLETNVFKPWDLSKCKGRMQVREKYGTPVIVDLTTENGGIVLSNSESEEEKNVQLHMTAEQTDILGATESITKPRKAAVYDLEIIYESGDVQRALQGGITISPNITREVSDG